MINGFLNFLIFIFVAFVIYSIQDAKYNDKLCDLYYQNFKLKQENEKLKRTIYNLKKVGK